MNIGSLYSRSSRWRQWIVRVMSFRNMYGYVGLWSIGSDLKGSSVEKLEWWRDTQTDTLSTYISVVWAEWKLSGTRGLLLEIFFKSGEMLIMSSRRTLFNRDAKSWHFRSKDISFSLSSSKVAKCQRYICEKYWQLLGGHPLLANQASSILVGFTNNS